MASKENRVFNLLKPVSAPPTTWDKIYDWLLGKARIVVLLTELIIAVTFALKVIEDTSAKNKEKEIERLNSELGFYANELEPNFRRIQNKVKDYQILWDNSNQYSKFIQEVFSYMENPSAEISVIASSNTLSVLGFDDLEPLRKLEDSLKNSASFTKVEIKNLSSEAQEIIDEKGRFALEATIANFSKDPL